MWDTPVIGFTLSFSSPGVPLPLAALLPIRSSSNGDLLLLHPPCRAHTPTHASSLPLPTAPHPQWLSALLSAQHPIPYPPWPVAATCRCRDGGSPPGPPDGLAVVVGQAAGHAAAAAAGSALAQPQHQEGFAQHPARKRTWAACALSAASGATAPGERKSPARRANRRLGKGLQRLASPLHLGERR